MKGKPKVQVWLYTEDGVELHCDSITSAAKETKDNVVTARNCLHNNRISIRGYLYSKVKLTPQEVLERFEQHQEKHPKKDTKTKERFNDNCKERIGSQEFAVNCSNRQITYVPRNRQSRVNLLKKLIWTKLEPHWMIIPTKVANIEKRAFTELLESLK